MERMSEYHGNRKHANSSSVPALNISLGNNSNNSSKSSGKGMREQDQYMPIANVIRIMRRVLPGHAKISDDAKETVQECVSEYISFVTGEANDRCQREQRKTVTAEDVLWAMAKLGFDDYVEPLTLFLNRLRASSDANAAAAATNNADSDVMHHHHQYHHQVGPYGQPGFDLAPYQGVFDAMGGSYFRDGFGGGGASGGGGGGGGSSSSSSSLQNGAMASYDPFAHYK